MLVSLLAAAAMPIVCNPITGAQEIVERSAIRWLFVGESDHGTNEKPRMVADLACAATAVHRPVTVAIEHRLQNQPMIDVFVTSDGGSSAVAKLLSAPAWDRSWADGKSSLAMLGLFEWLRTQHRAGKIDKVVAFDADMGRGGADRERQMAARLRAIDPGDRGIVIVLTGSFHAQKRNNGDRGVAYPTAAAFMPAEQTFSLLLDDAGGAVWNCRAAACKENTNEIRTGLVASLSLVPTADGAYDGVWQSGTQTTASPPAN